VILQFGVLLLQLLESSFKNLAHFSKLARHVFIHFVWNDVLQPRLLLILYLFELFKLLFNFFQAIALFLRCLFADQSPFNEINLLLKNKHFLALSGFYFYIFLELVHFVSLLDQKLKIRNYLNHAFLYLLHFLAHQWIFDI
jgi:hypothetical protein